MIAKLGVVIVGVIIVDFTIVPIWPMIDFRLTKWKLFMKPTSHDSNLARKMTINSFELNGKNHENGCKA